MKKVRITENSKQALCLLFSVILLAGTVTGIILPLRETKEQLQERIRLMEKKDCVMKHLLLISNGKKDRGSARSGCFIYNSVFRLSWKTQSRLTQSTSWPGAVTFP